MQLDEVANQINELIVGHPANKAKFHEHIEKIIREAEKYGQYLRSVWQKAKKAGLTHYDENKDKKKWFWWTAYSNDWSWGECVYFDNDEWLNVQFYIEGEPKLDPLAYLHSMIWGSVGQVYEGLELLDYQFVLLAIIHDAQNWQAGREKIYFNPLEKKTLSDRLCQAVCHRLEKIQHRTFGSEDVHQTIETALRAVKAYLTSTRQPETKQKGERNTLMTDVKSSKQIWEAIEKVYGISKNGFGKKINFVKDSFKRKVIFRDVEHAFVLESQEFSKPATILAGGVIEELLRLYLEHNNVKTKSDRFAAYIEACEKHLKHGVWRLTDSVRDFRNLVHLAKETEKRHTISKATAKGAVSSIFTIVNDFQ